MSPYGSIYLREYVIRGICLNKSDFTIIDRVLNMFYAKHGARSLCKLMRPY